MGISISKKRKIWPPYLIGLGVLVAFYVCAMVFLPAPKPKVDLLFKSGALDTGTNQPLPWPSSGQAAVGAVGYGVLQSNNADKPTPMASTAKIILALAVLRQKPLELNQAGPTITITPQDVVAYQSDLNEGGSVVRVEAGEQLTEYQALQALLLPSGNNIASVLANWAFGSEKQYIDYAKNMLSGLGLTQTYLADASGFSPKTASTASELVVVGEEALKNPVIAQIVSQKEANLPLVGRVKNVNSDLGQRDINGIKTGNTDQAGGCLLFSAIRKVGDKNVTLVGAVMAMADLGAALSVSPDLVDNGYNDFVYALGLPLDKPVGTMTTRWAAPVNIMAEQNVSQVVWNGTTVKREIEARPALAGEVGQAKVGDKTTQLKLESNIPPPTITWRLTHPLQLLKEFFQH